MKLASKAWSVSDLKEGYTALMSDNMDPEAVALEKRMEEGP